jgi:hypothetical protein
MGIIKGIREQGTRNRESGNMGTWDPMGYDLYVLKDKEGNNSAGVLHRMR